MTDSPLKLSPEAPKVIKQAVKRTDMFKLTHSENLNGDDIAKMKSYNDHDFDELISNEEFKIIVDCIRRHESLYKQRNHLMTDSPQELKVIKQAVKRKQTQSEKLKGDYIAKMKSYNDHDFDDLISNEEFKIMVACIRRHESLFKQRNHLITDSPVKSSEELKSEGYQTGG
ncbi:hypothetical protein CTI12_AA395820 [Artemisia annua]|uniref:Uncharacterized protein n=1 Tax=Artemisia annua TaxID=35608 RepID=A0A2U1MCI3_ARTAN|nr:hypothetical protein CTI12_AA395820 [Artemisia annua]